MLGHEVTVFEAREKLGGLNEYGIAAYKTVDDFAQREVDYILAVGGIAVNYGKRLGREVTLAQLRDDFDAVFLGMGMGAVNALGLAAEDLEGVEDAVAYIADLRQAEDKGALPVGRRVVVIGGGMTAIDVAVQSKRLGAEEVTIVYRRGKEQMKASAYEQELAQICGVGIRHWAQPKRLLGEAGKVTGVEFEYTQTGTDGRLEPAGETFALAADMVFKAIGQAFRPDSLETGGERLELTKGRIAGRPGPPDHARRRLGRRRLHRGRRGPDRGRGRGRQGGGGDHRPLPAQRGLSGIARRRRARERRHG